MPSYDQPTTEHTDLTWQTARTLADLGEMTARWLLGETPDAISYDGPPDPETALIDTQLAVLNRRGFVTYGSQPGQVDEDGRQRAFVEGLCDRDVADRIHDAALPTDLIVLEHGPRRWGRHDVCAVPISVGADDHVYTVVGDWPTRQLVRLWMVWGGIPRRTRRVASRAVKITIFDPRWGRNDLLWDTLVNALDIR